jgi:hypothetical protein
MILSTGNGAATQEGSAFLFQIDCAKIHCVPAVNHTSALDAAFIAVWQQALVDCAKKVTLGGKTYPVRRTAKHSLAQVDFEFDEIPYRALEQNRQTNSRWAQLARKGAKVMQILSSGRYLGVVVDGKLTHYSRSKT